MFSLDTMPIAEERSPGRLDEARPRDEGPARHRSRHHAREESRHSLCLHADRLPHGMQVLRDGQDRLQEEPPRVRR